MLETDETKGRQELHAKFDAITDARIKRLEDERERGHKWIDEAPLSVLEALTLNYDALLASTTQDAQTASAPPDDSTTLFRFSYKEEIRKVIESWDRDANISTPPIHNALKLASSEIRDNPKPLHVRAQIATALKRLADDKYIRLYREGGGSIPHTYRRHDSSIWSQGVSNQGEAVEVELNEEVLVGEG